MGPYQDRCRISKIRDEMVVTVIIVMDRQIGMHRIRNPSLMIAMMMKSLWMLMLLFEDAVNSQQMSQC